MTIKTDNAVAVTTEPTARKRRGKLNALKTKVPDVPTTDNPYAELRKLVHQHRAAEQTQVALHHMSTDRKRVDPETFKPMKDEQGNPIVLACRLQPDVAAALQVAREQTKDGMARLTKLMLVELKKLPIYNLFLSKVFGIGPVTAAYLCAEIQIDRATKVSNVHRFCGLGMMPYVETVNGKTASYQLIEMSVVDAARAAGKRVVFKLERKAAGRKNAFNSLLRSKLFVAISGMRRLAAPRGEGGVRGTSKYLDIWAEKKNGMLHRAPDERGKVPSKGEADKAGWHVAARVLVEDLYIVWRAIEGLPVWPSYAAAKLGYSHGGKICVNEPRMLTVEQALEAVGFVGRRDAVGGADLGDEDSDLNDGSEELEGLDAIAAE